MRIKRERVVFEENQRLEGMNKELRLELDKFVTENKELRLKMDIVMEDNGRLKNLLISYQNADQVSECRRPGHAERRRDFSVEVLGVINNLIHYFSLSQERRRSMEQPEERQRPGKPVLLLKEDM